MHRPAPILLELDRLITFYAESLDLTEVQLDRARSLAVAGTVATMVGLTTGELFALIQPAFERWQRQQRSEVQP